MMMKTIDTLTNSFIKKLLVVTVLDFVVIIPTITSLQLQPSEGMAIFLYVPFVAGLNILAGIFLLVRKSKWALPFFINVFIAPIILFAFFDYAFVS